MTTALGIAAVTATLREMLREGIVEKGVNDILGVTTDVSVLPTDRVPQGANTESSQINVFLHRVSANAALRNEGLPSRDESGRQRLTNSPLALDLYYLITAYGGAYLHAEMLLGFALQWLHERPVLTRSRINSALTPKSSPPTAFERALAESGLADQVERIKFTPVCLTTEEISKFWSATQSHLRPTVSYRASVLLIEADEPVRTPLPVLTRGEPVPGTDRDEGVQVQPHLDSPLPMLVEVEPAGKRIAVRLGEVVNLTGSCLDGSSRTVILTNDRFAIEHSLAAMAGNEAGLVQFTLPTAAAADYPVGVYRVGVRLVRPGETEPRESNRLALTIAPEITTMPASVVRDSSGTTTFSISFLPALRVGQRVLLVLGQQEYEPQSHTRPATSLDFVIENAPPQAAPGHLVRLRIDGIDSPIIDRTTQPPTFLDKRLIIT